MWSIIAASVVVLPEPVGPVTSTRPRCSSARRRTIGGSPSSSIDGMPGSTRRSTSPTEPRWRNTLTRNRPRPASGVGEVGLVVVEELVGPGLGHERERDALGVGRRDLARCSQGSRWPSTRRNGGEPTLMWTSEASRRTDSRSRLSRSSKVVPFRTEVGDPVAALGIDRRARRPEDGVPARSRRISRRRGGARGRATASTTVVPGPPEVSGLAVDRAGRRADERRQAGRDRVPERVEVVAALEERDQPARARPSAATRALMAA